jgi:hypothetical protein
MPGRAAMVVAVSEPIQRPLTHRGANCSSPDGRRAALVFEGPHNRVLTSLSKGRRRDQAKILPLASPGNPEFV